MLGRALHRLSVPRRDTAREPQAADEDSAPISRSAIDSVKGFAARPVGALTLGLTATVVGAVAAQLISPVRLPAQSVALVVVNVLWVVARLPVMRLANRADSTIDASTITMAWSAGALLQLAAVTPALRTLAWLIGAILSLRVLLKSGASPQESLRLVLWGYGIEVAGFFLVAAGRNLDVAVRVFMGG